MLFFVINCTALLYCTLYVVSCLRRKKKRAAIGALGLVLFCVAACMLILI